VPFATAYLGEHHFHRDATLLYLATLLLPSLAYVRLQSIIRRTGKQGPAAEAYHREMTHKGLFATLLYIAGIPLSFLSPWLGIVCAALVALFWCLPESPFDRLFD